MRSRRTGKGSLRESSAIAAKAVTPLAIVLAAVALTIACLLAGCVGHAGNNTPAPGQEMHPNDAAEPQHAPEPNAEEKRAAEIERIIDGMTIEQKVAQLFVVTPEAITGVTTATAAGEATREAYRTYPVGGLIYFAKNLNDTEQARTMLGNTQNYAHEISGLPVFLCVDEEGGTVTRIGGKPGFNVPNVGDMANVETPEEAGEIATTIAAYLADLGFNVDFAPDADIANVDGSSLARRSFGSTADEVSPFVKAQVESFLANNMLCSAKHFPGIGGALGDSHNESIYSEKTLDEMAAEELRPFEAAIEAKVPFIMVGHLTCEVATGSTRPASLNPVIIRDVLRTQLGYQGIIITDSLAMAAATQVASPDRVGVELLNAGGDMILMPADFQAAYQGVLDAVASGEIPEARIDESLERVVSAKLQLEEGR